MTISLRNMISYPELNAIVVDPAAAIIKCSRHQNAEVAPVLANVKYAQLSAEVEPVLANVKYAQLNAEVEPFLANVKYAQRDNEEAIDLAETT